MKKKCPRCGKSAPVFKAVCRCCGKPVEILRCPRCGEFGRPLVTPKKKSALSEKEIIKQLDEFCQDPKNRKGYLKVVEEGQDFLEAADKRYEAALKIPGIKK